MNRFITSKSFLTSLSLHPCKQIIAVLPVIIDQLHRYFKVLWVIPLCRHVETTIEGFRLKKCYACFFTFLRKERNKIFRKDQMFIGTKFLIQQKCLEFSALTNKKDNSGNKISNKDVKDSIFICYQHQSCHHIVSGLVL